MKTVYLAGPITDCNNVEANDWRAVMSEELGRWNIRGISPLRCEPLHGERYTLGTPDPRFGVPRAIASKNFLDVQMCDMTLCYLPKYINERRLSIGTIIELAWAHALRKPTILVSDYPFVIDHPVVQANAGWIVSTLDEGVDIVTGILGDYAQ
jgi:nucleoside 2-deoxyribosyltransferase